MSVKTADSFALLVPQAILHYHPDQQANTDAKWQVLCEEICKELNLKYEVVCKAN
jgi:hypothetical protein